MTASFPANPPLHQVRALYDEESITVYQAYSPAIADPAVAAGTFVPPFKRDRMTWIKPSFLWMMYRSGWATKQGQERVLAIRITRAGFERALSSACLTHFDPGVHADHDAWRERKEHTPNRVQWDPERNLASEPLAWRSIQIGLGGHAVHDYVDHWTLGITDVTDTARRLQPARQSHLLPDERPYPLPLDIGLPLGVTP